MIEALDFRCVTIGDGAIGSHKNKHNRFRTARVKKLYRPASEVRRTYLRHHQAQEDVEEAYHVLFTIFLRNVGDTSRQFFESDGRIVRLSSSRSGLPTRLSIASR